MASQMQMAHFVELSTMLFWNVAYRENYGIKLKICRLFHYGLGNDSQVVSFDTLFTEKFDCIFSAGINS